MEYFIVAAIAFFFGWKTSEFFHVVSFKKILEDLGVESRDLARLQEQLAREDTPEQVRTIVVIRVEQHQGCLYAYERDQDRFIAQAQDGDQLLDRILAHYPANHRIVCAERDGGELISAAVKRLADRTGR